MYQAHEQELVDRFEDFFRSYCADEIGQLAQNYPHDRKSLAVDWEDLYRYDPDFADEYVRHPDRFREAAEEALRLYDLPIDVSLGQAHVRVQNLSESTDVRELRSEHLNTLVSLTGTVDEAYTVESQLVEGAFVCQRCGTETVVPQGLTEYEEPYQCESCEESGPFKLDPEKSEFTDFERFVLRDTAVDAPTGEAIETVTVHLTDDLAGTVSPGDTVTVVGVVRLTDGVETSASIADKVIDATSVTFPDPNSEIEITEADKKEIVELSTRPDIYEQLVDSLAPTVYGYRQEKLALILQLFGGVSKRLPDDARVRGTIHTLLVGDPGCAKSALLDAAAALAPKALTANGDQSTKAGLTAAAERTTGGSTAFELRAGPLVLADQGLLAIDDLDEIRADDRSALKEPMEHQRLTVSKGDVNAVLQARTAIAAAASPKYGRFDRYEPIAEQFDIDPSLFTHFDLVFTVTDQPDEETDAKVADRVLQANYAGELDAQQRRIDAANTTETDELAPAVDPDLLRKYIAYSRRNCVPTMTDNARDAIREFYVTLRSMGADEEAPVPVTARKLEALVRLAEASARVRLADEVAREDAMRAIEIVRSCLQDIGVDPVAENQTFDADIVAAQSSDTQQAETRDGSEEEEPLNIAERVQRTVQDLAKTHDEGAPVTKVIDRATAMGLEEAEVEQILDDLKQKGEVYQPAADRLRST